MDSYRRLSAHGGLLIYIRNDFSYTKLNLDNRITETSNVLESLVIEVWRKSCKYNKFVIGSIYRIPSYSANDLNTFTEEFITLLNAFAEIYSKLDPSLNADPNSNYEILSKILCDAKTNHIPRRSKKLNKRKDKIEAWMTDEILTTVVRKNKMYVKWNLVDSYHSCRLSCN